MNTLFVEGLWRDISGTRASGLTFKALYDCYWLVVKSYMEERPNRMEQSRTKNGGNKTMHGNHKVATEVC